VLVSAWAIRVDARTPARERTPIEVAVTAPEYWDCVPGSGAFDAGLREELTSDSLGIQARDAGVGTGVARIANRFCLSSQRPGVRAVRIRVHVDSDICTTTFTDYAPGTPDSAHGPSTTSSTHWLIRATLPLQAKDTGPPAVVRVSCSTTGNGDCTQIGRIVGLVVLEALHHRNGVLAQSAHLALPPRVWRDSVYREASQAFAANHAPKVIVRVEYAAWGWADMERDTAYVLASAGDLIAPRLNPAAFPDYCRPFRVVEVVGADSIWVVPAEGIVRCGSDSAATGNGPYPVGRVRVCFVVDGGADVGFRFTLSVVRRLPRRVAVRPSWQ
jgi:hypothetical protein